MHHLAILVLCVLAFGGLALAMERHQEDLFARLLQPAVTTILRSAGWLLLCGSLAMTLRQPLWQVGIVAWFGHLSAGAGIVFVAMLLAQRRMSQRARR